jgi:hypothetical protein
LLAAGTPASVIGGASTIRFERKSGDEELGIVKDPFEPETFAEKTPVGSQKRLNLLGAGVMRLILPASMAPPLKVIVDCASGSVRMMIGRAGSFEPSAALVVISLGKLKVLAVEKSPPVFHRKKRAPCSSTFKKSLGRNACGKKGACKVVGQAPTGGNRDSLTVCLIAL